MLSGEIPPTTGDIRLSGMDMFTRAHECRKHIGFCPQFDALFELLTAREHLTLYGRLKGIEEEDVARVVNEKIGEMGLTEYADRLAGTFSGGNKRKLSVAMAMIGEPSIVFLDGEYRLMVISIDLLFFNTNSIGCTCRTLFCL